MGWPLQRPLQNETTKFELLRDVWAGRRCLRRLSPLVGSPLVSASVHLPAAMISSMRRHSQLTVEMRAEADMELEQRRDSLMTEQDATRVSRRSRVHSSDNFFIPNATGRRRSSFSDETADFLKRLRSHFWSSKDGPEAGTSSPLDALFGML